MSHGPYPAGRKTVFVDIDGTIIHFLTPFSQSITNPSSNELLPGVYDTFQEWEAEGSCIILTTARPECLRNITEQHLLSLGLFWHQLIMNVGNGPRLLINDRKPNGDLSAFAINVPRNKGLTDIKPKYTDGPHITLDRTMWGSDQ